MNPLIYMIGLYSYQHQSLLNQAKKDGYIAKAHDPMAKQTRNNPAPNRAKQGKRKRQW